MKGTEEKISWVLPVINLRAIDGAKSHWSWADNKHPETYSIFVNHTISVGKKNSTNFASVSIIQLAHCSLYCHDFNFFRSWVTEAQAFGFVILAITYGKFFLRSPMMAMKGRLTLNSTSGIGGVKLNAITSIWVNEMRTVPSSLTDIDDCWRAFETWIAWSSAKYGNWAFVEKSDFIPI